MPKRKTKPKAKPKTDNHIGDIERMLLMNNLCQVIADHNTGNEEATSIIEAISEWVTS